MKKFTRINACLVAAILIFGFAGNQCLATSSVLNVANSATQGQTATTTGNTEVADSTEAGLSEAEIEHQQLVAKYDGKRIPKGITIEGQTVSGMTYAEAEEVVNQIIARYDEVPIKLVAGKHSMDITAKDLRLTAKNNVVEQAMNYGVSGNMLEKYIIKNNSKTAKNYKVSISCNLENTIQFLEINKDKMSDDAKNNYIVKEKDTFKFVEGKAGEIISTENSAVIICNYINNNWNGQQTTIEVVTEALSPKGTKEELAKVKDLLGTATTDYRSSGSNRAGNVETGVNKLNAILLYPGDEVSVYNTVAPFTAENGYFEAVGYENGKEVPSMGGGICQVSTTLYMAALASELEIVKRSAHQMIVSYVKPSEDAAISECKDLIIKNNKDYPVYIEGITKDRQIYFNIYGVEDRPANRVVTYEPEVLEFSIYPNEYREDVTQGVGYVGKLASPHVGYKARLWKVVTVDGEEVSREPWNYSTYNATAGVYAIGIGGEEYASQEVYNAVVTQNQAYIDSVVSKYAGKPVSTALPGPVMEPTKQPEDRPDGIIREEKTQAQ